MFGLLKRFGSARAPAAPSGPSADRLVPRIKHVNFIKALQARGLPPEALPQVTPLCGELLVTYAFEKPDGFVMANAGLLAQAGVAAGDVARIAAHNLKQRIGELRMVVVEDGYRAPVTGDDLEATLLLLDEFWASLQPNIAGPILAVAPRRDRLLMCDANDASAAGAMLAQARRLFDQSSDEHALSTQPMVRSGSGWAVWQPN